MYRNFPVTVLVLAGLRLEEIAIAPAAGWQIPQPHSSCDRVQDQTMTPALGAVVWIAYHLVSPDRSA